MHDPLRCQDGDHDTCLDAQLAAKHLIWQGKDNKPVHSPMCWCKTTLGAFYFDGVYGWATIEQMGRFSDEAEEVPDGN